MTKDDSLDELKMRLASARAKRDQHDAVAQRDAFVTAQHHVRVLERRLDQWLRRSAL
jgi:hypothetical protein